MQRSKRKQINQTKQNLHFSCPVTLWAAAQCSTRNQRTIRSLQCEQMKSTTNFHISLPRCYAPSSAEPQFFTHMCNADGVCKPAIKQPRRLEPAYLFADLFVHTLPQSCAFILWEISHAYACVVNTGGTRINLFGWNYTLSTLCRLMLSVSA